MTPIEENKRILTPADYLTKMKDEQGIKPKAWARSLAGLVTLGVLPEEEATEYANTLADGSQEKKGDFWTTYNIAIQNWKESSAKR